MKQILDTFKWDKFSVEKIEKKHDIRGVAKREALVEEPCALSNGSITEGEIKQEGETYILNHQEKLRKYLDNVENLDEEFFPHNDLIKVYKNNHIYVNLARIESFGVTIIEALASGLPVITFNTKGGNELIKNDYNGIIVKNISPEQIVNAIDQYYKDIILYEKHKK